MLVIRPHTRTLDKNRSIAYGKRKKEGEEKGGGQRLEVKEDQVQVQEQEQENQFWNRWQHTGCPNCALSPA